MITDAGDEICRDDACERDDIHVVHPLARFKMERVRSRIHDDGTVEDVPTFWRTRLRASAPFVLHLYNADGLDFGILDRTTGVEHVGSGYVIAIPAHRIPHNYEIAVANRTRARPMCCLAAFPGERGMFRHQLTVEREPAKALTERQASKAIWELPSKEALREAVVRNVSAVEAKTYQMLKYDVINDYGKISETEGTSDRTLYRAIAAVIDAGQIIRVHVGQRLWAYLKPGSSLLSDPHTIRDQLRDTISTHAW